MRENNILSLGVTGRRLHAGLHMKEDGAMREQRKGKLKHCNRYEGSEGRSDKRVQSETGLTGRVGTVKMILTKINDRFSRLPNKGCVTWFKSLQQHLEIWGKISLKIKIQ